MSDDHQGRGGDDLTERTFGAAQWQALSTVVQAVLQFTIGVVLARLLPPKDFGLLALALLFVGLAGLFSTLGLGPTIIQRSPLTTRHIRAGFTLSTLLGLAIGATLILLAPRSTAIFPNDGLPPVLRLVALTFPVSGVGNVAGALLRRRLDFRRLFWIGNTSYVVGYACVAIPLAVLGYGVWSLAVGALAQTCVLNVLLMATVRHPVRPLFAIREFRELTSFGMGFTLDSLMLYGAHNGDNLVVGRWLGDAALGLYTRAYALMMLPQEFFGRIFRTVLFPAFAEVQGDRPRMGRGYRMSVQLTTIMGVPVLTGMAVAAPHLIVGLYGPDWRGAVPPLQILCMFGLFRIVYPLSTAVAQAAGRVYLVFFVSLGYAIAMIGGGVVGSRWGLAGVAYAVGLALLFMYLGSAFLTLRVVGLRWRDFAEDQLPGVLLGCFVGGVAYAVRLGLETSGLPSLVILVGIVLACAVALPLGVYFLPGPLRPRELVGKLAQMASRLPSPARVGVLRFLRGAVPSVDV